MKTADRGYGGAHQKRRAAEALRVARGDVFCARCGGWISPVEPWDLGHHPVDRSAYVGPLHRRCNRDTRLEKALRRPRVVRPDARSWL